MKRALLCSLLCAAVVVLMHFGLHPAAAAPFTVELIASDVMHDAPSAAAPPAHLHLAPAPAPHPILGDLQVRRAIAYCTDRDALIAAAYPALTPAERAALAVDSPIPAASWAYSPPAITYPYNPATGRALLDAAGWTLAPGAEHRTKGGNALYLTLTSTDAALRQAFLAVFEAQMRDCGIQVVRSHQDASWFFGRWTGVQVRDFEMSDFAWFTADAPDLVELYGCAQIPMPANDWTGSNMMGWCNPAADAAATQANNAALTQAERKAFYATFTNLFAADVPSLPLFRRNDSEAWEHIDFNLETYAQGGALTPAGTGAAPLVFSDHQDLATTVAAPAGAVAEALAVRYTPLLGAMHALPGGQTSAAVFHLEAVQGGVPAGRYDLAGPVTVTVAYADPAARDDYVEDSLALYVWDDAAGDWQPAEQTCPPAQQYAALDTAQRTVTAHVCHFSEFALLAEHRPDLTLRVNYGSNWVEGSYPAGHTVWLTVTNSSGAVKATAELITGVVPWWGGETGFATHMGNPWQPEQPDLEPGDWVHADADNGKSAAVQIGRITGLVDLDGDSISGTVDVAWLLPGPVQVACNGWGAPGGTPQRDDTVTPDGVDTYACAWDPDTEWDVAPGQDLAVSYQDPAGHQVFNVFRGYLNDLILGVNYDHDWVEGEYMAGHTVWLTLTNSSGAIKATAELATDVIPWWGGSSGFSTNVGDPWRPARPDLEPGDWVYGAVDNGYTAAVQIGRITGAVDVDSDSISGTVDAAWLLPGPLNIECRPWGAPGGAPHRSDTVTPDGVDAYTCAWDPATEWDVAPGQDLAVVYFDPAGHQIYGVYHAPAPRMRVEKWLDGGEVGAGGNAVFTVQYRNEGDAAAEDVVITDTLQGLAYLGDTSGFPHAGGGGQVAWDLGAVAPGDWVQFSVFAQVTAAAGQRVTNTVEIATSNPYDLGEDWQRRSEWSGDVTPGGVQINLGKWAWTGDPAAGHDVVFHVNPCNNSGAGSTQVTITDTLPVTLTLQSWWSDTPGWTEVSRSAHALVVTKPVLGGWRCDAVYVRATVAAAAQPGAPLSNTATVYAANDAAPDDNEATWQGSVGAPRDNLYVHKSWGHGRLVPGGDLHYWIQYRNDGNVPAGAFRITETLPISTTFDSAWRHDQAGRHPLLPIQVGDGVVVWEFAGLDNGYGENFEVVLLADADAAPGTLLVNTAEITRLPGEDSYDDNVSTVTETLFDHGPNLRVYKYGRWDDWGEDTRRASYEMRVENVGDEIVYGVTVTDTFPAGMTMDGGLNVQYWRNWAWQDHGDHFTVTLELMEPAWNMGINFGLIAGAAPLPFGKVYTNTAQVSPAAGDANPADNIAHLPLATGPDLWVEKTVEGGEFLPGALVTYTLRFGNWPQDNVGYWGLRGTAWLTDTLPAGMSYVSAHQRWCGPDQPEWCPQEPAITGQDLVWELWPMGAGHWNVIRLVARVGGGATGLETLTNRARIASDQPAADLEVDTANNESRYAGDVQLPHFAISKAYESSRIAGLPVTYTLTITNVGHALATGLVITDAVPANVTHASGGSYDAGARTVTWAVASLAAGQAVQVQFVGTLGHSGQVVNDRYRVAASDQGVAGPWGAAVSFAIAPPTLTASFDLSAARVTLGEEVAFTDTSTTNGAAIAAWAWDFGDGGTSTAQHPKHAYTETGAYDVRLQVTDAAGHTATRTLPAAVTVHPHYRYLPLISKSR